jgi:predicted transcriptional regulator
MEKKMFTTRISNELFKHAKKLAIDLERPLNDLLEEAILDLLKKYQKKPQTKD